LTYKMAIALRPQICDVTSPYVYIALQSNRQCYPTTTTIMIGTFARRNIAFAHCTTPSAPKTAQNTISSHIVHYSHCMARIPAGFAYIYGQRKATQNGRKMSADFHHRKVRKMLCCMRDRTATKLPSRVPFELYIISYRIAR